MDLGLPPIDPEKAFNAFENIRKAFQEAASADTGAAQPLFQSLSDKFNKMVDDVMELGATDPNISPSKIMFKMMPVIMDVQKTASQLQRLAQTDERVAETMATLAGTIKNELTSLLPAGGLGGLNLPGLGGLGGGNSTPASEDKPNINPKKPKKPGNGGSFDL